VHGTGKVNKSSQKKKPNMTKAFFQLLRTNHAFRALWLSGFVSQIGDWFNEVAVLTLVESVSGQSAMAVAYVHRCLCTFTSLHSALTCGLSLSVVWFARILPFTVLSPIVGWMADRFDRLWLMFVCDIARALLIVTLLVVNDDSPVWFIMVIKGLLAVFAAQFDPCRSAVIPVVRAAGDPILCR